MKDRIVKGYRQPVNACCQFMYKDHQISASTLINENRLEVAVFRSEDSMECLFECFDVESAIEFVNRRTSE